MSLDEAVHGAGAEDEELHPERDEEHEIDGGPNILQDHVCLAYHVSLVQLVQHLQLPETVCKKCGKSQPFTVRISSRGTASIITWVCSFF